MPFRLLQSKALCRWTWFTALSVALMVAVQAQGATIPLGTSGWEASFDDTLDPFVDIIVEDETAEAVFIRKIAEFTQGPNAFGLFPPIPIAFEQTSPNAVNQIIINDELITNSTGVDWTDFHFELFAPQDPATFNTTLSAGFSISPFVNQMFGDGDTTFWVDGGVVPDSGQWRPGAASGELVIDVITGNGDTTPFTIFTLKEEPTPEPTTIALLGMGAALYVARRRKARS